MSPFYQTENRGYNMGRVLFTLAHLTFLLITDSHCEAVASTPVYFAFPLRCHRGIVDNVRHPLFFIIREQQIYPAQPLHPLDSARLVQGLEYRDLGWKGLGVNGLRLRV